MTRKIENQMIAAIRASRSTKLGNTEVKVEDAHGTAVYLHGSLIAEIGGPNGPRWTLAGWNTPTTRSRINALARAFNWTRGVYCRKGEPYASDPTQAIDSREWIHAL